ncbi:MAG: YgiQ family radical SAM protein, partial [Muribaculaceae bacterium]|nr:YgiQ family radical SAM protein [Muribaculaceae bacterium]
VYTATTEKEKLAQRQFFFWYKPDMRNQITEELQKLHRPDLIRALYPAYKPSSINKTHNHKDFNNSNKPNNKKTRK